jgi:ABC-type phosphate transport system substrate-binding protein
MENEMDEQEEFTRELLKKELNKMFACGAIEALANVKESCFNTMEKLGIRNVSKENLDKMFSLAISYWEDMKKENED